jgi:hypothetical protein
MYIISKCIRINIVSENAKYICVYTGTNGAWPSGWDFWGGGRGYIV